MIRNIVYKLFHECENTSQVKFCAVVNYRIKYLRIFFSDTTLLIMTHRSKDTWSDLVKDQATDLFSISVDDTEEALVSVTNVVSRIKQGK